MLTGNTLQKMSMSSFYETRRSTSSMSILFKNFLSTLLTCLIVSSIFKFKSFKIWCVFEGTFFRASSRSFISLCKTVTDLLNLSIRLKDALSSVFTRSNWTSNYVRISFMFSLVFAKSFLVAFSWNSALKRLISFRYSSSFDSSF